MRSNGVTPVAAEWAEHLVRIEDGRRCGKSIVAPQIHEQRAAHAVAEHGQRRGTDHRAEVLHGGGDIALCAGGGQAV